MTSAIADPVGSDPRPIGPIAVWRPLTPADAPALTELTTAARLAEGAPDEVRSVDEVRHQLTDPGFSLATDSRGGFTDDGRLLAWGSVWCRLRPVNLSRALLSGDVHPTVLRQGIGRTLVDWQRRRAIERLRHEMPAGLPRRIDLYSDSADQGRAALAASIGLTPVRWFSTMKRSMRDPIQALPVPAGLEVVAWTDDRLDAALDARDDAWRDHWGYEPMPPDVWRHLLIDDPAFLRSPSRLAMEGERVVGFALCTKQAIDGGDGRTAWLDLIAVRREWRRRGVASALIRAALVALGREGFATATLSVDSDSPTGALGLYRRHGFRVARSATLFAREVDGDDPVNP